MQVKYNGNLYTVRGKVRREKQQPLGTAFRTVGQQRQEDLQIATAALLGSPIYGFGLRRVNTWNDPKQFLRLWDATCDTRWPSGVVLPILEENVTDPAGTAADPGLVVRASADFKGDLYTVWDGASMAPPDDTKAQWPVYTYDAVNGEWDLADVVNNLQGGAGVSLDLHAHKTHLLMLIVDNDDHLIYRSSNGTSFVAPTTQLTANLLLNDVTKNEDIDAGLLATVLGDAVAILWHEDNGTITFESSTDAGDNWTDEGVDIASGNGPQGVAVMPGPDGDEKLYVATHEGVYEVDTSPATWTFRLILPLPPSNDNGRRMTVHQGRLWVPVGVDDDSPAPVYTIEVTRAGYIIDTTRGLDQEDALPSNMLGPIRWIKSAGKFLFASIGGEAASRNARVICHNGFGWHSVRKHGTANEEIQWIDVSPSDDGMPRLHYAIRTASNSTNTKFLGQPLVSPSSGVSINQESAGALVRPGLDGGMPSIDAAWLEYFADAADLSADTTGEHITVKFGTNGADADTNNLTPAGKEVLSGDKDKDFPDDGDTSRKGTQAISIQIEETLNRGSTKTNTPTLRNTLLKYLKKPTVAESFAFTIDLAGSTDEQRSEEEVRSALETARDTVTLVELEYAQMSAKLVHTEIMAFDEAWSDDEEMQAETREGFARVLVRELR